LLSQAESVWLPPLHPTGGPHSVPAPTKLQVPGMKPLQVSQTPEQAVLQQTPVTQKPLMHSLSLVQVKPGWMLTLPPVPEKPPVPPAPPAPLPPLPLEETAAPLVATLDPTTPLEVALEALAPPSAPLPDDPLVAPLELALEALPPLEALPLEVLPLAAPLPPPSSWPQPTWPTRSVAKSKDTKRPPKAARAGLIRASVAQDAADVQPRPSAALA
jgi:homeobox protein ESX1